MKTGKVSMLKKCRKQEKEDEYVELLIESERGCALRGLNITVFHEDDDGYYSDARESLPYHNAKQANLAL